MARAAFHFGSQGASVTERLTALEDAVEAVLGDTDAQVLPQATHFGGGTVYPTSSDFPQWFRYTPEGAPYAATLMHYNNFPMNAMMAGAGAASELHYMRGDAAANQLDIPNFAWNRIPETGALRDIPFRAYIDNIDLEIGFNVQWTPDSIISRRPWECRVMLVTDNEPFQSTYDNISGEDNQIVSSQFAVRDLFAAQPGVDPAFVYGESGRTAIWPYYDYHMCDQVVRSPLRASRKDPDEGIQITTNQLHSRQYAQQLQLGQFLNGGPDYRYSQQLSIPTSTTAAPFLPSAITYDQRVTPDIPDFPQNSPQEFIFTSSPRDYSVYRDMVIKLDPPPIEALIAGPRISTTQLLAGVVTSTVELPAGGVVGSASNIQEALDNRCLQKRYVLRFKIPVRALQAWSQGAIGDTELRVLNRKFKLLFVHSPTRYWGFADVHPYGSHTSFDTWASAGSALPASLIKQAVQCPSVRMTVGLVIHYNRKTDRFTEDYQAGLDIKNADPRDDPIPGSGLATTAAWQQGQNRGTSTATFYAAPKRPRVE